MEEWKTGRSEGWKTGTVANRAPYGNDRGEPNHPTSQLILTSPDQGSRYRLSAEIPREVQQIAVAARPTDGVVLNEVTLLADGRPLLTLTGTPYQALWPMTIGTHVFTAVGVDLEGNELTANDVVIEVID
jgi:hypothetical protein